jgi:RNA polymerase subunit RPABC4/transcription elongation factor Spt4
MPDKPCHACGEPFSEDARLCKECETLRSATETCVACGGLIPPRVSKCTRCDSYQDWRRWFGMSATVLGTLTALVSVIGLTITTISALSERQSVPTAFVVRSTGDEILVSVVNNTRTSATIRDLTIESEDPSVITFRGVSVVDEDRDKLQVGKESAVILTLYAIAVDRGPAAKSPFWANHGKAVVLLKGTAVSGGSMTSLEDRVTLNEIEKFVKAQCDSCT